MTFDQWLAAVDEIFVARIGFSTSDLPDLTPTRELYDERLTPAEAAEEIAADQAADSGIFGEVWG